MIPALLTAAVISISFLLFLLIKKNNQLKKYGPIIDVESEVKKTSAELNEKKEEVQSLKEKYQIGKSKFDELQKHINALEESAELMDFGLYKPHFDFDTSSKYKDLLQNNYERQKSLIQAEKAISCPTDWTVNGSKVEGRKMTRQNMKIMLRAFNGECDASISKVRWDNVLKMEERIRKSFEAINKSGQVNNISITNEYLNTKLEELHLAHELAEKIKEEKDEQRRIQEEMREEEKARRDFERAKNEAEKEEERYQKALEKARADLEKLSGDKAAAMDAKIAELEAKLIEAKNSKERAISQAQLTKSGHVYIISNIGSFGDSVYKIGMTRRLDPLDRVKELGDASVPFSFDVHAMIYSENAPELEYSLHKKFASKSVNLVNFRKEFFNLNLDEIIEWASQEKIEINLTKIAQAKEFRESQKIRSENLPIDNLDQNEKYEPSTSLFDE